MGKEKLAIVGTFFDGYYPLWEDFLELFFSNWPNCPYQLYIVNDERELAFKKEYNVKVFHAGKNAEYSKRVQTALENIDAEYYLLLLEDFFIGRKLEADVLNSVINRIEKDKIKYYRMPLGEFTPFYKKNRLEEIGIGSEYTVSCQPSIWKREFLKKCIGSQNYNAWVFEGIYSKAKKAHTKSFLDGCWVDYRNVLGLYHGAVQGKFLNATMEHFSDLGYTFKANLPKMDIKQERKYKIRYIVSCLMPNRIKQCMKRLLKSNTVFNKYSETIDELITEMGLDKE